MHTTCGTCSTKATTTSNSAAYTTYLYNTKKTLRKRRTVVYNIYHFTKLQEFEFKEIAFAFTCTTLLLYIVCLLLVVILY